MELEGTLVQILPLQEGVSKQSGNPWKKQQWILETAGQYPRRVMFQAFNARIDNLHLEIGKRYVISLDAESREFNGRWYTDLSAYAARPVDSAPAQVSQAAPAQSFGAAPMQTAPAADPFASGDSADDLPF